MVYDSNGAHFARKTKKEKDLTQREQSLAEGMEESCSGALKRLHRVDRKGDRQRRRFSFVCEYEQRPLRTMRNIIGA